MMPQHPRKRRFSILKKITAIFVSVCFIFSESTSFAAMSLSPGREGHANYVNSRSEIKVSPPPTPLTIPGIQIPEKLGIIKEIHSGQSGHTVVVIQDAHAIPSAQVSIQRLIDFFQKKYGVRFVAVEGASSQLDPQIFRSFPDKELLNEVFQKYIDRGEVTGSTLAAIFNVSKSTYHGVEDWNLFEEGLPHFFQATEMEPALLRKLEARTADLTEEKKAVYSKQLFEVDQTLEAFYENHQNLLQALKKIADVRMPEEGTELALLYEESKRHLLDDRTVQDEVRDIADRIQKLLRSHAAIHRHGKSRLIEFNQKYQELQTSRITPETFALFMREVVTEYSLPIEFSDNLRRLMRRQKRMRDIQGTKLLQDFENYAQIVKQSLMNSERERRLDEQSNQLRLLKRFLRLEIDFEGWQKIKTMIKMRENPGLEPKFFADIKSHVAFYENTEKRDRVMIDKLQALMRQEKAKAGILVAGGFHTQGLTRQLRERDVSYLLVMPHIDSVPKETNYRAHMRGDVSWKKHFQVENGRVNLYKAFVRGVRDQLIERSDAKQRQLLKQWRDQIIRDLSNQHKVSKAGEYTAFIDEVMQKNPHAGTPRGLFDRIEKFIQGLRGLEATNHLTAENILSLLKLATRPAEVISAQISPLDSMVVRGGHIFSDTNTIPPARAEARSTLSEDFLLNREPWDGIPDVFIQVAFKGLFRAMERMVRVVERRGGDDEFLLDLEKLEVSRFIPRDKLTRDELTQRVGMIYLKILKNAITNNWRIPTLKTIESRIHAYWTQNLAQQGIREAYDRHWDDVIANARKSPTWVLAHAIERVSDNKVESMLQILPLLMARDDGSGADEKAVNNAVERIKKAYPPARANREIAQAYLEALPSLVLDMRYDYDFAQKRIAEVMAKLEEAFGPQRAQAELTKAYESAWPQFVEIVVRERDRLALLLVSLLSRRRISETSVYRAVAEIIRKIPLDPNMEESLVQVVTTLIKEEIRGDQQAKQAIEQAIQNVQTALGKITPPERVREVIGKAYASAWSEAVATLDKRGAVSKWADIYDWIGNKAAPQLLDEDAGLLVDGLPKLIKGINSKDPRIRAAAIRAAGNAVRRFPAEQARGVLRNLRKWIEMIGDENAEVRNAAKTTVRLSEQKVRSSLSREEANQELEKVYSKALTNLKVLAEIAGGDRANEINAFIQETQERLGIEISLAAVQTRKRGKELSQALGRITKSAEKGERTDADEAVVKRLIPADQAQLEIAQALGKALSKLLIKAVYLNPAVRSTAEEQIAAIETKISTLVTAEVADKIIGDSYIDGLLKVLKRAALEFYVEKAIDPIVRRLEPMERRIAEKLSHDKAQQGIAQAYREFLKRWVEGARTLWPKARAKVVRRAFLILPETDVDLRLRAWPLVITGMDDPVMSYRLIALEAFGDLLQKLPVARVVEGLSLLELEQRLESENNDERAIAVRILATLVTRLPPEKIFDLIPHLLKRMADDEKGIALTAGDTVRVAIEKANHLFAKQEQKTREDIGRGLAHVLSKQIELQRPVEYFEERIREWLGIEPANEQIAGAYVRALPALIEKDGSADQQIRDENAKTKAALEAKIRSLLSTETANKRIAAAYSKGIARLVARVGMLLGDHQEDERKLHEEAWEKAAAEIFTLLPREAAEKTVTTGYAAGLKRLVIRQLDSLESSVHESNLETMIAKIEDKIRDTSAADAGEIIARIYAQALPKFVEGLEQRIFDDLKAGGEREKKAVESLQRMIKRIEKKVQREFTKKKAQEARRQISSAYARVLPNWTKGLDSPSPFRRDSAVRAIGFGLQRLTAENLDVIEQLFPLVIERMNDANRYVRASASRAMRDALPALVDASPELGIQAARLLKQKISDNNAFVRAGSVNALSGRALIKLGNQDPTFLEEVFVTFLGALGDRKKTVRASVAKGIVQIAKQMKEVLGETKGQERIQKLMFQHFADIVWFISGVNRERYESSEDIAATASQLLELMDPEGKVRSTVIAQQLSPTEILAVFDQLNEIVAGRSETRNQEEAYKKLAVTLARRKMWDQDTLQVVFSAAAVFGYEGVFRYLAGERQQRLKRLKWITQAIQLFGLTPTEPTDLSDFEKMLVQFKDTMKASFEPSNPWHNAIRHLTQMEELDSLTQNLKAEIAKKYRHIITDTDHYQNIRDEITKLLEKITNPREKKIAQRHIAGSLVSVLPELVPKRRRFEVELVRDMEREIRELLPGDESNEFVGKLYAKAIPFAFYNWFVWSSEAFTNQDETKDMINRMKQKVIDLLGEESGRSYLHQELMSHYGLLLEWVSDLGRGKDEFRPATASLGQMLRWNNVVNQSAFATSLTDVEFFAVYDFLEVVTEGEAKTDKTDNESVYQRMTELFQKRRIWDPQYAARFQAAAEIFGYQSSFRYIGTDRDDRFTQLGLYAELVQGFLRRDQFTGPEDFETKLRTAEEQIQGGFDPNDPWHLAANYYQVKLDELKEQEARPLSIQRYLELVQNPSPYVAQEIPAEDQVQLRALAYEGYRLMEFIDRLRTQAAEEERDVVIVANKSYGRMALSPILEWIKSNNIMLIETKIASSDAHSNPLVIDFQNRQLFTDDQIAMFVQKKPYVVVVDGSFSVDHVRIRQFRRHAPRFPDAYQGYRNFFMAINEGMKPQNMAQNPEEFQVDPSFLQELQENEKFSDIARKAKRFAPVGGSDDLYKMRFWTPAYGSRSGVLRFSQQREIRDDRYPPIFDFQSDTGGPTLIMVQSAIERPSSPLADKEHPTIPQHVQTWIGGENAPAYFDDRAHFEVFHYAFEPQYGLIRSQVYARASQIYLRELLDYLGERDRFLPPEEVSAVEVKTLEGYVFDLTGTLAKLKGKILPLAKAKIELLLRLGKKVALVTDDTEKHNIERRVVNEIDPSLRKHLSIYLNGGNTLWRFNEEGVKEVVIDNRMDNDRKERLEAYVKEALMDNGVKEASINFDSTPYIVSVDLSRHLKGKDRDQERRRLIDKIEAQIKAKIGDEKVRIYLLGRHHIGVSLRHKVEAVEDFISREGLSQEQLLIVDNEAGPNENGRELLEGFEGAVKINVGRTSNSLARRAKPHTFQIVGSRSSDGLKNIVYVLQAINAEGNLVVDLLRSRAVGPEVKKQVPPYDYFHGGRSEVRANDWESSRVQDRSGAGVDEVALRVVEHLQSTSRRDSPALLSLAGDVHQAIRTVGLEKFGQILTSRAMVVADQKVNYYLTQLAKIARSVLKKYQGDVGVAFGQDASELENLQWALSQVVPSGDSRVHLIVSRELANLKGNGMYTHPIGDLQDINGGMFSFLQPGIPAVIEQSQAISNSRLYGIYSKGTESLIELDAYHRRIVDFSTRILISLLLGAIDPQASLVRNPSLEPDVLRRLNKALFGAAKLNEFTNQAIQRISQDGLMIDVSIFFTRLTQKFHARVEVSKAA